MPEIKLREYPREEYLADIQKELDENGLYESVSKRCDEINEESAQLPYVAHRSIQEWMCEILDLIRLARS